MAYVRRLSVVQNFKSSWLCSSCLRFAFRSLIPFTLVLQEVVVVHRNEGHYHSSYRCQHCLNRIKLRLLCWYVFFVARTDTTPPACPIIMAHAIAWSAYAYSAEMNTWQKNWVIDQVRCLIVSRIRTLNRLKHPTSMATTCPYNYIWYPGHYPIGRCINDGTGTSHIVNFFPRSICCANRCRDPMGCPWVLGSSLHTCPDWLIFSQVVRWALCSTVVLRCAWAVSQYTPITVRIGIQGSTDRHDQKYLKSTPVFSQGLPVVLLRVGYIWSSTVSSSQFGKERAL